MRRGEIPARGAPSAPGVGHCGVGAGSQAGRDQPRHPGKRLAALLIMRIAETGVIGEERSPRREMSYGCDTLQLKQFVPNMYGEASRAQRQRAPSRFLCWGISGRARDSPVGRVASAASSHDLPNVVEDAVRIELGNTLQRDPVRTRQIDHGIGADHSNLHLGNGEVV